MRETWVQSLGWEDPRRRERLPTPVFWPGEFRGLYSPWAHEESDTTERLSLSLQRQLEAGRGQLCPLAEGAEPRPPWFLSLLHAPTTAAAEPAIATVIHSVRREKPALLACVRREKVFLEIPRNVDVWLKLTSLPCTEKQERPWWECAEARQSMDPPQGWNNSFCVQFSLPPFFPVAYVSLTGVLITHYEYQFQWPFCLPPAALGSSLHSLVILIWYFLQFTM